MGLDFRCVSHNDDEFSLIIVHTSIFLISLVDFANLHVNERKPCLAGMFICEWRVKKILLPNLTYIVPLL